MKVYVCDISELLDFPGTQLLTQARHARMLRYYQAADKARCLAAGLMLRRVLGAKQAQQIALTPLGKPYLSGGPHFNLSHSGRKVVLLVSTDVAGVDIEQIAPYSDAVAKRVFTPREQAWLKRQESDDAFYRLWTGKESIMKALGLGFQLPPESFEILPEQGMANHVLAQTWYLHWTTLDGHMLCSATALPNAKMELVHLSRKELLE